MAANQVDACSRIVSSVVVSITLLFMERMKNEMARVQVG